MKKYGFVFLVLLLANYVIAQDVSEENHKFQITFNSTTNSILSSRVEFNRRVSQKGYYLNIGINLFGSSSFREPKNNTLYPETRVDLMCYTSLGIHRLNYKHDKKLSFLKGVNFLINPHISYIRLDNPALPIRMQRSVSIETSWGISFKYGIYYNFTKNFAVGSQIEPFILFHKSDSHNQTNYYLEYKTFSNYSVLSLKYSW